MWCRRSISASCFTRRPAKLVFRSDPTVGQWRARRHGWRFAPELSFSMYPTHALYMSFRTLVLYMSFRALVLHRPWHLRNWDQVSWPLFSSVRIRRYCLATRVWPRRRDRVSYSLRARGWSVRIGVKPSLCGWSRHRSLQTPCQDTYSLGLFLLAGRPER